MLNDLLVWALGALTALSGGSYLFTWHVYTRLRDLIDTLTGNHLAHIEERLERLEAKTRE